MQKTKPMIFLQGKRVYLRAIEVTDGERCQRWVNDPNVRQYVLRQTPVNAHEEKRWLESREPGPFPSDISFAIVLKNGDRHIGNTGIHRISWINSQGTTGALIGEPDCWNKGYGSEAKMLVLEYAFNTLNLHRINSCVLATNPRSLAYLKKAGYREEGRLREQIFRNGTWIDEIQLGILAGEWRKKQRKR